MFTRRVVVVIVLITLVFCSGVTGFMVIEGWNLMDSFYMTIITLTTTGFEEVHKLSSAGRIFTSFLLIFGMGLVGYSVSVLINDFITVGFIERRRKIMERKIAKLKDHTIICGYGQMGMVVCEELFKADNPFVVIEKDPIRLEEMEKKKFLYLEGDGTDDVLIEKAGIYKAKVFVSMVANDSDALYLSLAAKTLNPSLYIIVRASNEQAKRKILKTGANKVVLPLLMTGIRVAESVLNPNVEEILEISGITLDPKNRVKLIDINIDQTTNLIGKSLLNCGFKRDGIIVLGIRKKDDTFLFAPDANYEFKRGDVIVGVGTKDKLEEVQSHFKDNKPII